MRHRGRLRLVVLVLVTSSLVACLPGGDDGPNHEAARSPTPTPSSTATVASGGLPCPVPSDICELAHTFLPVIRTGDAQQIVDQATPQRLTCPSGGSATSEFALATVCAGHDAGTTILVYEIHGGKAPRYFSDREDFADAVSAALRQSGPLEVQIGAAGCGLSIATPGEVLSCDTSGIVMYELWDEEIYLALVFTRSHAGATWMIEKYWGIFPSAVPSPITSGARIVMYTFTGANAFEIYPYAPR